jgi:site-specific recombinase XerD
MNLQEKDIVNGIDDKKWLKIYRQKSDVPVNLPLMSSARLIISKYKNDGRSLVNGTIFPKISNQKVNSYLKEMGILCNINKRLTSGVARHTFATTFTLSNGMPIETVSKLLGHTKIATTQIYARVLERKISEDMNLLEQKLTKQTEQNHYQFFDVGS